MKINMSDMTIIKDDGTEKYGFISITEEEYEIFDSINAEYYKGKIDKDDFITLFGHNPLAFVLHGKTDSASSQLLSKYIDCCRVKESENAPALLSYRCFSGEKFGLDYTKQILHGSALDAWECLLSFKGNPKFGIVVNLKYI